MKYLSILLLFTCTAFAISCQKEISPSGRTSDTRDSLLGNWRIDRYYVFLYDHVANTVDTVARGSDTVGYAKFEADSSFIIYEGYGFGYTGKYAVKPNREMPMSIEKETIDDFGPRTTIFTPPVQMIFLIESLTQNTAILSYKMGQSNQFRTYRYYYYLKR